LTVAGSSDVLVAWGSSLSGTVTSAGPGFATRSTASFDLVEDEPITVPGSYTATATSNTNGWVMVAAAFRAGTAADGGSGGGGSDAGIGGDSDAGSSLDGGSVPEPPASDAGFADLGAGCANISDNAAPATWWLLFVVLVALSRLRQVRRG
jgi:hypothetical protein